MFALAQAAGGSGISIKLMLATCYHDSEWDSNDLKASLSIAWRTFTRHLNFHGCSLNLLIKHVPSCMHI